MAPERGEWTWGTHAGPDGSASFRLWAPALEDLRLRLPGEDHAMEVGADGWFELTLDGVKSGTAYQFVLPGGLAVPDPASRAQAIDVHGASILADSSFSWQAVDWTGRPWEEAVIYELHVGTFSPEGTFDGVVRRLDHLARTGFTAIELMPVAQFFGDRGWGYDGVLLYCPHHAYGGANGLKRLVNAAHQRGLMVILDVVYNHFGPDGNYLGLYAPQFFDASRHTPWGAAIRFEEPAVRDFFIENALYWLQEFRIDGLRFDAIDQISDTTSPCILEEMAVRIRKQFLDRHIHLTTEDERNIVDLHPRDKKNRPRLFTAEWNDDFHHAAHCLATRESGGYYAGFCNGPARHLARALSEGFCYQGESYLPWQGRLRGVASCNQPPTAFTDFLQNHDQIGNRAFGERLTALTSGETIELLLAVLLLNPQIPLLFMGEEYGETRPFLFFTDFEGELARSVREGRRREFAAFGEFGEGQGAKIPDPNLVATFEQSKLDWLRLETPEGARRLALVQRLLELRSRHIVPRLSTMTSMQAQRVELGEAAFLVRWQMSGGELWMIGNFGEATVPFPADVAGLEAIHENSSRSGKRPCSRLARCQLRCRDDKCGTGRRPVTTDLDRIAAASGFVRSYHGIEGRVATASDAAVRALLKTIGVDPEKPAIFVQDRGLPTMRAPDVPTCYIPSFLDEGRAWGVTCQLYSLRSHRNWGIGDFEDLATLGEMMARHGADFVGLNPLHALFLAAPEMSSPFYPADRDFLNPLCIAVDRVRGFLEADAGIDRQQIERLREGSLIDYAGVARCKLAALRGLYDRTTGDADNDALEDFRGDGGEALYLFALFQAISMAMVNQGLGPGWLSWPQEFHDPHGAAVRRFAANYAADVDFQVWLQWIANRQLGEAAERLRHAGMRIGLYLDLAVGTAPDGAATWKDRDLTVVGAEIGAPPDFFNHLGQKWGLAPVSPAEIVARDFRPIRASYDRILRHAGALRIDHAMSLYRLFWIPWNYPASDGAYALYPMEGIIHALAEASQARNALIIGEDLGVVPEGFRNEMQRARILGYRLFYFERNERDFIPPREWPRDALACVGSHDTCTLAGWWSGSDIDERHRIGLMDSDEAARMRAVRAREKSQAIAILQARGYHAAAETFELLDCGRNPCSHRLDTLTPRRGPARGRPGTCRAGQYSRHRR